MAENCYEGMFLLDSARFAADPDGVTGQLLALLEKVDAQVMAHRPWQDGKLAYQIEGMRKGLHYLTYFKMDPSHVSTLTRECHLSDLVVRQLVIKPPQQIFDAMVQALTSGGEEAEGEGEGGEATKGEGAEAAGDAAPGDAAPGDAAPGDAAPAEAAEEAAT